MGALPGPTGRNKDLKPEEIYSLQRHIERVLIASETLPSRLAEAMLTGVYHWPDFVFEADLVWQLINSRTDHNLEGWEKLGFVRTAWRMSEHQDFLPMDQFLSLPTPQQDVVRALWSQSEHLLQTVFMSPSEVFESGQKQLKRLPGYVLPDLLGERFAREITVTQDRMIVIKDREIDSDPMVFWAQIRNRHGASESLAPGEKYFAYLNPYNPTEIHICDTRRSNRNAYLGTCLRTERHTKLEYDKLAREYGQVRAIEAEELNTRRRRGMDILKERMKASKHNASIMLGDRAPAERKGDFDPASLLPVNETDESEDSSAHIEQTGDGFSAEAFLDQPGE